MSARERDREEQREAGGEPGYTLGLSLHMGASKLLAKQRDERATKAEFELNGLDDGAVPTKTRKDRKRVAKLSARIHSTTVQEPPREAGHDDSGSESDSRSRR